MELSGIRCDQRSEIVLQKRFSCADCVRPAFRDSATFGSACVAVLPSLSFNLGYHQPGAGPGQNTAVCEVVTGAYALTALLLLPAGEMLSPAT